MPGYLFAAVTGQRLPHRFIDLVELEGEGRQSRFGGGVRHLGLQHQSSSSLYQNAYGGLVPSALDQVTFQCPVITQDVTSEGRRWMLTISGIWPLRSSPAERGFRPLLPSRRHATGPCATPPRDTHISRCRWSRARHAVRVCRVTWCAVSALFAAATTATAQHVGHHRPQRFVRVKLCGMSGLESPHFADRLRITGNVSSRAGIARQIAADRRRAALQGQGNRSGGRALQRHPSQRHALFSLHLLESSRHLHTLPGRQDVAFQI